jgi:hypothetical protein
MSQAQEDRIHALREKLEIEKNKNQLLEKAEADKKSLVAVSTEEEKLKSQAEKDLEAELSTLVTRNAALEISRLSPGKPQGSRCFIDVDGRVFFLFDYRGASERADASLAFRRMSNADRLRSCMSGMRLDVDVDKLRGLLEAASQRFYFPSTSTASVTTGWKSAASRLNQVRPLPVWKDMSKFEKFISGKWRRYEYANISLVDFFVGVFDATISLQRGVSMYLLFWRRMDWLQPGPP